MENNVSVEQHLKRAELFCTSTAHETNSLNSIANSLAAIAKLMKIYMDANYDYREAEL